MNVNITRDPLSHGLAAYWFIMLPCN